MEDFIKLCTAFVSGIADFFDIQIPFLGISIFTLFAALLIIRALLVGIKIIFGTDHGQDSA